MGQRLRERVIALFLVAVGIAVALALGEAALRAAGFSLPTFYMPDDVVGFRLRPGAEGWSRKEAEVYVKINTHGLGDREHATDKPHHVYRIAVLGDSYAEAKQVQIVAAFWTLLPQHLARGGFAPGKQIQAINFGVSGYGTAQEILTLRHRAWDYAPDLVLPAGAN